MSIVEKILKNRTEQPWEVRFEEQHDSPGQYYIWNGIKKIYVSYKEDADKLCVILNDLTKQRDEMVQFILEVDYMTTTEFCNKYGVPLPVFTGEVGSSVNNLLQIDAIKCKMFIQKAKELNRAKLKQLKTEAGK